MHGLDLIETHQWHVGSYIGLTHSFFALNIETLATTWLVMGAIITLIIIGRFFLLQTHGLGHYIVKSSVKYFFDFTSQSLETFSITHCAFIMTAFIFVLGCNIVGIIPGLEKEPTADLNTTLALSIISFLYAQGSAIAAHGIKNYIMGFLSPFFLMLPLNIVGRLTSIISLAFRLFGNIFGGSIITGIYFGTIKGSFWLELLGLLSGLNLIIMLFFNIFEGFLQAFVFTTLSLTYLSIALSGEGH